VSPESTSGTAIGFTLSWEVTSRESAASAAHAHDQLYRGDFHAFRRLGQPVDPDIADEVDQLALAFDEEVMVIARIGVEISGAEVVPVSETGG